MYKLYCCLLFFLLFSCEETEYNSTYYFIHPNSYYMVADGKKELVLNVMKNEETLQRFHNLSLVEDEIEYYHNGNLLPGNTFATLDTGEHKFYARYHGWQSEEIIVIARAPKEYELISIPVIFHILYDDEPVGEGPNVSQEDAKRILEEVNQRFSNTYYSTKFPDVIKNPNHVDAFIKFRLAKFDPEGNLLEEPGIMRYGGYDPSTWENTEPQAIFMDENMWSPYNYINISIANQNHKNAATMPVASYDYQFCRLERTNETWEEYYERNNRGGPGIVFKGILLSLNGFYNHKTLAHELGHYFGLLHTFSYRCNDYQFPFGIDDCLEDTQFYDETKYVTPQNSLSKIYYECNSQYLVHHDNIMDYYRRVEPQLFSTYYGFTYDQRDRMHEILEYSPWIKELKYSEK
ncbi:MAG: M43 family zinc metalloprotease [Candidatus Cyclobacteriaceae bacterium M2_1C_046]